MIYFTRTSVARQPRTGGGVGCGRLSVTDFLDDDPRALDVDDLDQAVGLDEASPAVTSISRLPNRALPVGRSGDVVRPVSPIRKASDS